MTTTTASPLTDLQRSVLEFARLEWKSPGRREAAVRELFDISIVRFNQILTALLDHPEALAYDAQTVRRLCRIRDERKVRRTKFGV